MSDIEKAREDCDTQIPHARRAAPQKGKPDQLKDALHAAEDRQEALIEETFPASDPVSVKRIS